MLKRLLLLWIFSGSLDSFSQDLTNMPTYKPQILRQKHDSTIRLVEQPPSAPDTLRAICLVTLFPNGIAHARMGYVVICEGKEVQYLDCRKNALKLPQVGWGYRVVNPNEKLK